MRGNRKNTYQCRVCFRVTKDERERLERDAGKIPLSAYARRRLCDSAVSTPRSRGLRPLHDHRALAQLLGALGQSHIANNLNQIAKALNSGSLPVTPETEQEIP